MSNWERATNQVLACLSPDSRGSKPLWQVFWVDGVFASHVLFGAIFHLYPRIGTGLLAVLLVGFLAYTAWIMRAVWVNAFNVANENVGHLARALTVVWALNAVLVSGFLVFAHMSATRLPPF